MIRLQSNGKEQALSRLGLGCMRMVSAFDPELKPRYISTIQTALDEGINFLNTGDHYGSGHSELILGEAIRNYSRDQLFVSVKFGGMRDPEGRMYGMDVSPFNIKNYLTYSLKRLNLDYIDLYQPSRIDVAIPVEETIGAIADLVKAGYVRHIGISQVDADTLRRAHATHPISLIESYYSIFDRRIEQSILPTARELGIGVVAFGILAHGMLSGNWGKNGNQAGPSQLPDDNFEQNLRRVTALQQIADEKQVSLARLATAWVLAKGEDIIPLVGASRPSTLVDSLQALHLQLNEEDLQRLEAIVPLGEVAGPQREQRFRNAKLVQE